MKTKSLFLTLTLLTGATVINAQASASATTSAEIITPIGITKVTDMNFGIIAANDALGTVVLDTNDGRTSSQFTFPGNTGTVNSAKFTVTGDTNYTYAITLPSSAITLTHTDNVTTMSVGTFTSNPSSTGTLTAGTQDLFVGATLNIAASQKAGVYTNSTVGAGGLEVTVNYN